MTRTIAARGLLIVFATLALAGCGGGSSSSSDPGSADYDPAKTTLHDVIHAHGEIRMDIEVDDPGVIRDVDRQEDLESIG